MKSTHKATLFLLVLGIIFVFSIISNNELSDNQGNYDKSIEVQHETQSKTPRASARWNNFSFIHIDGNWTTASGYEWCSGDGSSDNPYIIENITIDASSSPTGSGIYINNSKNEYFLIDNCMVYNAINDGITLENTNNGTILKNNCSYNGGNGILLYNNCNNITLSGNIANNNTGNGIFLRDYCDNNIISENTANNNTGNGIRLLTGCNYNTLTGNTVNNNGGSGIIIQINCDNNTISGNNANINDYYGIHLRNGDDNIISGNTASNNGDSGIYLYRYCWDNSISRNIITNNHMGIYVDRDARGNLIFYNYLSDNSLHNAYTDYEIPSWNYWDNGSIGNFWGDYSGVDANGDGIGDTHYGIPNLMLPPLEYDNFPIWDFIKPNITIIIPTLGQTFGIVSPVFEVPIIEQIYYTSWYTIDDGITNVSFSTAVGIIDQDIWTVVPYGHITLRFFARDFVGNEDFKEIIIIKDDKLIDIDIVNQSFTETEFLIKFTVLGIYGQEINNLNIQMWWNGTVVPSNDVNHLGGGLYSVSLTPITVAPGDDPILLNMTISASGYPERYYETYIAVDPEVIEKPTGSITSNSGGGGGGGGNDELPIPLIILGSSIAAVCVVVIMAWKKGLLMKLKRKN